MTALTIKQETFVQGLLDGLTQIESYKKAYNCGNMSDKAIAVAASKLFNNPKITLRYSRLLDAHASQKMIARADLTTRMMELLDRATEDTKEHGFKQGNIGAMSLAVNTLKELNGLTFNDDISVAKLQLEVEKIELAKAKLNQDDNMQKENGAFLRAIFERK